MRRAILVSFAVVLSTACASRQPVSVSHLPTGPSEPIWAMYDAPATEVWPVAVLEMKSRWGTPASMNQDTGIIETAWLRGASEYLVTADGKRAPIRFRMQLRVVPAVPRARVKVVSTEQVLRDGTWIDVPSARTKEIEVAEAMNQRLGFPRTPARCPGTDVVVHTDYGDCRRQDAHRHNRHGFSGGEHACPIARGS